MTGSCWEQVQEFGCNLTYSDRNRKKMSKAIQCISGVQCYCWVACAHPCTSGPGEIVLFSSPILEGRTAVVHRPLSNSQHRNKNVSWISGCGKHQSCWVTAMNFTQVFKVLLQCTRSNHMFEAVLATQCDIRVCMRLWHYKVRTRIRENKREINWTKLNWRLVYSFVFVSAKFQSILARFTAN